MCDNCPLCDTKISRLRSSFVRYVISDEAHMQDYEDGTLTFDIWKESIKKELEE